MKKRVFGRQLSRERDTRRALFRSLIRALVSNGKIKTTKAKAKAIQGKIDTLVSLGKKKDISARRRVYAILGNDRKTTDFIFGKIASVFSDRKSGFTRIINLPRRLGDQAEMVRLEWSSEIEKSIKPEKGKTKAKVSEKDKTGDKVTKSKNKGKLAMITESLKKRK
jgi:large subunit ribosomal protein L17